MLPISVIIPAYNEAESISKVVNHIASFMAKEKIEHEIIVIDDCSTDNTAKAAKALNVKLITHPINRGYGASLTTGLKNARYAHVLIMDADESYAVDNISKLAPYMDDFDMVIGARQGKHYYGSFMKRLSRMVFYVLLGYVTGERVPDANSGFRIFKKDVVMQFEDDFCSGFSFTTTITIILMSNHYLIKFVPIDYMPRTGKSKVRHLRDTARTVQILIQNISYYNPIKAFLPFSVLSLIASIFSGILWMLTKNPSYMSALALGLFSSMLFLGFGMMAHVIVKGGKAGRR